MFQKVKYWLYRLQFNHPEFFNHKPIHLDLELIRACNLNCTFCYRQAENFKENFPDKVMFAEEATFYLKKYYKQGFRAVKFNWRGEPLLHAHLGSLASIAKSLGYLDRMINTNLATPNLNDNFLNNLDSFTEIRVSLDTMIADLYAKMRTLAKLHNVLKNLSVLIKRHNPNKTRLIIQRRTNDSMENDSTFAENLRASMEYRGVAFNGLEPSIKIISKPIQPRSSFVEFSYSNGTKFKSKINSSYFEQWKNGFIHRKYCKQPSQRLVVGVDGKEWSCCLAYGEPKELAANNQRFLVKFLNEVMNYPSTEFLGDWKIFKKIYPMTNICYKCTSFSAYEEKENQCN